MKVKEMIILAGGQGSRLASVIGDLPKVLAPIKGRPFLDYLLEYFFHLGIERFILALGKGKEEVKEYCSKSHYKVHLIFSEETEPLGTGGALKKALNLISEEYILASNGDSLVISSELSSAIKELMDRGVIIGLIGIYVQNTGRFGRLLLNSKGELLAFKEKVLSKPGVINTGLYLLKGKEVLNLMRDMPQKFSFESWLESTIEKGLKIEVRVLEGYFVDIGVPEDYFRAQEELPRKLK